MTKLNKAQYASDVFTTEAEAVVRSRDLGLNGTVHVYEYNGQAVYMPGSTHQAYLDFYAPDGYDEDYGDPHEMPEDEYEEEKDREALIRAVVQEILKVNETVEGEVLKVDDEQRLVYGWASVITEKGQPVIDRQGDVIKPETLVAAVNKFMEHVRVGKSMHDGEQIGVVVHSWPVTDEIAKAVGIQSDREGWLVAFKVYDDTVWAKVKSGELAAFSIGGRARKEEYNA